jgi:hypothetical protein
MGLSGNIKFLGVNSNKVDLVEKKDSRNNGVTEYYTAEEIASDIIGLQGPQGVEGPVGPQGPIGPVGPAGLEWQGQWSAEGVYVEDDAVGYDGASWFCINDVGPSATPPDEDTANWALLAAQGAQGPQGPQGAQGPTGPQGPQGVSGSVSYTEGSLNSEPSSFVEFAKLEETFTRVFVTSPTDNYIGISNVGLSTGHVFVVQNKSMTTNLIVRPLNSTRFLQPNGFSSQIDFIVKPNTYARFTLVDNTSGSDKVFMVEVINPLGMPNLSVLTNSTTSALSLSTLNSTYPSSTYVVGTKVFCGSITGGGLVYIKTGESTWVSQLITNVT